MLLKKESGQKRKMKKICTIRDVAKYTNVAPSTVSRVLNNRMGTLHVAEETRERILAAARELNYSPNIHAKRLFSRCSKVIGIVLPAFKQRGKHIFSDVHLVEFFSGMEFALEDTEYRLMVVFNNAHFVKTREYSYLFREREIDGMLVWGACSGEEFWNDFLKEAAPVLFLTNPSFDRAKGNYLLHDYQSASDLVFTHLCERGHRKIGWIAGIQDNGTTVDQERGIAAVRQKCSEMQVFPTYADFKAENAALACADLLKKHPDISAIAVSNTSAAEGVWNYLRQENIEVPKQIALAACDGLGAIEPSQISRIIVNDFALGELGIRYLLQIIHGECSKIQERLPIEFKPGITT